jgi:hypothetical protein
MQFAAPRLSLHTIKTRQEGEMLCTLFNRKMPIVVLLRSCLRFLSRADSRQKH